MTLCTAWAKRLTGRSFALRPFVVGIVAAGILALAPNCLAVELFGPHLRLATGDTPSHAVTADFDGNGVLDFATANFGNNTVSIVLGDGQGGFDTAPEIDVLISPIGIAVGDFNTDGVADLVVTHLKINVLLVLMGDGTGGFSASGETTTGADPVFVAAGDFDLDGTSDVAVANGNDDTVSVFLGNGAGGFTTIAEVPVGDFPRSIAVADLNSDGVADLAVTNLLSHSVSILTGDGFGGFVATGELPVGEGRAPTAVVVEDLDLDGDADLAVTNGSGDSVSVFLGDGLGNFGAAREVPGVGDSPVWLAASDVDDDGDADLAVANFDGGTVVVLRGDPVALRSGDGGFTIDDEIAVSQPRSVVAGDFTGNGATDLVVVSAEADLVTILPGDGLGGFGTIEKILDLPLAFEIGFVYPIWPVCIRSADFDGDDHLDIAVTGLRENAIFIYPGDGEGNFLVTKEKRVEVEQPNCIAVDDLDGDGNVDIAVPSGSVGGAGAIRILGGDGRGDFSPVQEFLLGPDHYLPWATAADVDLDGRMDLVVADFQSDAVLLLSGSDSGDFSAPRQIDVGDGPSSLIVEDLDSDGERDMAVVNVFDGTLTLHPGLEDIGDPPRLRVDSPESLAGNYEVGTADFGPPLTRQGIEGLVELAVDGVGSGFDAFDACEPLQNELDGRIAMAVRGNCAFATKVGNAQEAGATAVIVVNNSPGSPSTMGGADPTIRIPSVMISLDDGLLISAALPGVQVTLQDESAGRRLPVGGGSPRFIAGGDFNDDGSVDLALASPNAGIVHILTNNGDGSYSRTYGFLANGPVQLVVDDFNLDGLDDLAYVTFFGDAFGLLINAGDGQFVPVPSFRSGRQPSSVISADFNEDGAPDLAAVNFGGESVSVLFNQIKDRVDTNGSNRVDGFDLIEIHRRSGIRMGQAEYSRLYDVDLNGVIDGDDWALVASRFGETIQQPSPLLARIDNPHPANPNTITLQPRASEGNRLTVDVLANADSVLASSAEFAVTYGPAAGDPDPTPVLEAVGDEPGDYFSGGLTQALDVDLGNLGEAKVRVTRLPSEDRAGGQRRLMSLIFEARRPGASSLEFSPLPGRAVPTLLDSNGNPVSSVGFVGGVTADVVVLQERALGQKISFSPELLDFGTIQDGAAITRTVRLANFGFADLEILDVASTRPEFSSYFAAPFTIAPSASVELPVRFAPPGAGVYTGELMVSSSDPKRPVVRVPVLGRSGPSVSVTPTFVQFGSVPPGESATRRVSIGNRGNAPLRLSSVTVSEAAFTARVEFLLLNPDESGSVEVEFRPGAAGELHGALTLSFGAAGETTVVLNLAGSARAVP